MGAVYIRTELPCKHFRTFLTAGGAVAGPDNMAGERWLDDARIACLGGRRDIRRIPAGYDGWHTGAMDAGRLLLPAGYGG